MLDDDTHPFSVHYSSGKVFVEEEIDSTISLDVYFPWFSLFGQQGYFVLHYKCIFFDLDFSKGRE